MELIAYDDPMTLDIIESGCVTWEDLVRSVRNFKYGRGVDRSNFNQVWYQRMGTCSTKHGFLYQVAKTNGFDNVKLIIGMYLMNAHNTPKVAKVLSESGLKEIPEAHCYLKVDENYLDATSNNSSYDDFSSDLLEEMIVEPEFLIHQKVDYHREFIKQWVAQGNSDKSSDELWFTREKCIQALSL